MKNQMIEASLADALSRLVDRRDSEEGTIIALPSVYTSGAPVQVSVSYDGAGFFVNDMGLALNEAELMGATSKQFNSQAREIADEYGVRFDNHSFFAVHVQAEELTGAIKIIGSASLKSVVATEGKLAEQNDTSLRSDFVHKIQQVFGSRNVAKDVEYHGSSTHSWKFAASVQTGGQLLLFDTASQHPVSIYSAHAKFSDLRMLEISPKGVIGISSARLFKPDYRNLLQQVANVVETTADNSVISKLAA